MNPADRPTENASLTDRLSGIGSPIGRRGYLGLLGATASIAAVTSKVRSATVVNLGDEGLTDGDRIDPYIDDHLSSGVRVVVPTGQYRWGGGGLNGKRFTQDAELVGDGMVTLEWDPNEPAKTDVRADGCTFRMENFTFVGEIVTGDASDDHRINPMAGADGVIEFVNVHMPDGNRGQSESEASGYYVGHDHDGTVRWISCSVEWFGNNGWYASSGGKDGTPGRCEWIGCFARNNNIAGIRTGSGPWLIKDTVIVNDANAPSRIDGGRRQRGIRIDEPNGPGRLENVHITVDGPSNSPPFIASNDSSGFEASADGVCIRNENGEAAINFSRPSTWSFTGRNLHLTGSGDMSYDGDWSNACVGDGCERAATEPLDGDGSSGDDESDSDGDQDPNTDEVVVEVISTNDSIEFDYEFDADGPVTKVLDAGGRSAERSNDDIVDNGDGTYTVSGHTGFGLGDTFRVEGSLLAFRTSAAAGDFAVYVDGDQFDTDGGSGDDESDSDGDQDTNDDEALVEVLSTDDATEFDYEFTADGPVTKILDAGDMSAERTNDDIVDNGDGTYTVSGHTGFGLGDTFRVEGSLLAFRPDATAGQCAVHVDGTDVTSEHLLPNRIVIEGTSSGRSQYTFEVSGQVAPAPGTGPLEAEDTISGSVVEGEIFEDVDAYYFSGDIVDYSLLGGATVVIEDRDG